MLKYIEKLIKYRINALIAWFIRILMFKYKKHQNY